MVTSFNGRPPVTDGEIPQVGDLAPDFTLLASTGGTISLADYRDKQEVVLYFYPKDDTPGCTVEACSFRDNIGAVQGHGAIVLGVSPDDVKSHEKFTRKFELNFPLLSDVGALVSQAYGVWVEKNMYGRKYMGVERSTFLIGKDGKIRQAWRKVTPKGHVDAVLSALEG
jgi:thioredoxin-dependent peroxiredoxin